MAQDETRRSQGKPIKDDRDSDEDYHTLKQQLIPYQGQGPQPTPSDHDRTSLSRQVMGSSSALPAQHPLHLRPSTHPPRLRSQPQGLHQQQYDSLQPAGFKPATPPNTAVANNYNVIMIQPSSARSTPVSSETTRERAKTPGRTVMPSKLDWDARRDKAQGAHESLQRRVRNRCCSWRLLLCFLLPAFGIAIAAMAITHHRYDLPPPTQFTGQDKVDEEPPQADSIMAFGQVAVGVYQYIDQVASACACAQPFELDHEIVSPACGGGPANDAQLDSQFHFDVLRKRLNELEQRLAAEDASQIVLKRLRKQIATARLERVAGEAYLENAKQQWMAVWIWDCWIRRGNILTLRFWTARLTRSIDEEETARVWMASTMAPMVQKLAHDSRAALDARAGYLRSLIRSADRLAVALDDSRGVVCGVGPALDTHLAKMEARIKANGPAEADGVKETRETMLNGAALFHFLCYSGKDMVGQLQNRHGGGGGGGVGGVRPDKSETPFIMVNGRRLKVRLSGTKNALVEVGSLIQTLRLGNSELEAHDVKDTLEQLDRLLAGVR